MMRDLRAAIRNQPPAEHAYDWDPLHMPGSVQSYGVLLVADPKSRQVQFCSENAAELLGVPASDIIDRSYLALCDNERERRAVKDAVETDTILFPNPMAITIKGRAFDAVFHSHAGAHLIELEPANAGDAAYADMSMRAVEELYAPNSVEELYQRAVRVVRDVTGFDRVMLYRFDARYNGQVLAEAAREGVGSFLGLFFPSSDIGARVRDLYLKNFTRYIPDIAGEASPLIGTHQGGGRADSAYPVDMTHANLRSVVPCHTNYLKNMGVLASMSFSINVDDRLWGLFACHHYAPRLVSYEQRVVCEQSAMMFIYKLVSLSSTAARMAQRARAVAQIGRGVTVGAHLANRLATLDGGLADPQARDAALPMLARAMATIHEETHWLAADAAAEDRPPGANALTPQQRMLLDLVEADSAAVVRHGCVHRIGDAPPEMAVFAIASMFGRELPDLRHGNLPVFATDNLSRIAPVTEAVKDQAAGVLAVSLSDDVQALLLWFRREQIVHATWAGNPAAVDRDYAPGRANPRGSFAAWKQDIRNLSRPWAMEDVETAYDLLCAIRGAEDSSVDMPVAPVMAAANVVPVRMAAARAAPPPASHAAASPRRIIRVGQL